MVLQCDLIRVATPFFMTSLVSTQFVVMFVFLSDVMVWFCTKQRRGFNFLHRRNGETV